jgi:dihydrodipicolinate synthase
MAKLGDKLKQILVPLITPFEEGSQDVDYKMAEKLVEHLISKNFCDTIIVAGTTGEFNTLSNEERIELFKVVKGAVNGRVPLVAGTGAASTRDAVKLTQAAEKLGYDAAMVVGPYYCKPSQEGIYQHYATIAANTGLEMMLYNIPIFTGMNISPETVGRLSKVKNIVGIKDEAGINPTQMTEYAGITPKDFTIYNGDDIMILCGLVQGACGVVSGASHLIGDKIRKMINLFLDGKVAEAREIHMAIDPLFKAFCPNGRVNPMPVLRAAVELIGLPVGAGRLPLDEATPEEKQNIKKHLIRLGVL